MSYIGDFLLGDTIDTSFTTVQSTGAPTTLAGSPVISAYVGNSTTEVTAGITLTVDFDSRTGYNHVRVVASNGNGYATASNYRLVITTGTVNSVSVVGYVVAEFSIQNRFTNVAQIGGQTASASGTVTFPNATLASTTNITAGTITTVTTVTNQLTAAQIATGVWQDATSGDFTVSSSIGKSLYTAGVVPGGTNGLFIAGTNAATTITTALTTTFTGNVTGSVASVVGAVGSVTGAVGSVTGNVGGNVTGSVGSVTGLTASNLDTTVSSRMATYSQPSGFLAATFPSGTIANTTNITAGTITTVTNLTNAPSAGDFTSTMKTSLNAATPASIVGAVGSVTGNVGGNVTGSVGSVVGLTASNLDATITSRMASYSQPSGFLAATFPTTVASPTNITAGTITTVTNLTNAATAGDFTSTMKTSLNAATPAVTVSDKTGFSLTSAYDAAKTAVQTSDLDARGLTTIGGVTKIAGHTLEDGGTGGQLIGST